MSDILLTPNTSLDPTIAQAGSNSLKYNESPLLEGTDNQRAMAVEYNPLGVRYTTPVALPKKTATASQTVYSGTINADGSLVNPLPTGWGISAHGSGRYTITHNLNTTLYSVTVTVFSPLLITIGNVHDVTSNAFSVTFWNQVGAITWTGADTPFMFTLALH